MDDSSGWADPVAYLTRTPASDGDRAWVDGDGVESDGARSGAGLGGSAGHGGSAEHVDCSAADDDADESARASGCAGDAGDGAWDPGSGVGFEASAGALELDAEIAELLGRLRSGVEGLLAIGDRGDLMALGPRRLIAVIQGFEAHRNALAAVDALLVEAAGEERLAAHVTAPSLSRALSRLVKISPAAAAARVRQAEQILPQQAYSAGRLECEHPALREAVRAGALSGDQHAVISSALRKLATNPEVQPAQLEQAENALVGFAASLTPEELKQAARVIDDCLLPDGALPEDELTRARRGLRLGPARRDGTHQLTGSLTPELHAKLCAVLSPLAAPKPSNEQGADRRSAEQRAHDALEEVADRILDSDTLPHTGGAKMTLHVTITLEQLRRRLAEQRRRAAALGGYRGTADPASSGERCQWLADTPTGDEWVPGGWNGGRFNLCTFSARAAAATTFGTQLSISELLRLAEQAEIIPTVLNDAGGVLAYGRARRFASPSQVKALIGRDKGCSFPGCTAPPEWCESHHIVEWWRGGATDIDNLTLLCGYHHREFLQRGWRVQMHDGIPIWIPPPWVDTERRPQTNTRITGLQHHLDLSLLHRAGPSPDPAPEGDARPDAAHDAGPPPDLGPEGDGRPDAAHAAGPPLDNRGVPREALGLAPLPAPEHLDDLDPLDDLIGLLEQHVPTDQRDHFHRELADLLTQYSAAPDVTVCEPTATA